jgi:hypothetical protein
LAASAEPGEVNRAHLAALQAAEGFLREVMSRCGLLRDIRGNPFRPTTINPSWLRWGGGVVVRMAQAAYEERRFGDVPILADALKDAGCDDVDVLSHCRSGGACVRGCWVLDALLGKA